MKLFVILFLSLALYVSIANADQKSHDTSIEKLVQNVKNHTGDERRVAMNALKVKLRSMNQQTRQLVMRDLQRSFANGEQKGGQGRMNPVAGRNGPQHKGNGPQMGAIHASPAHNMPATVPQHPSPSIPQQSSPQVPHTQPVPPMHAPSFGQPGGRK